MFRNTVLLLLVVSLLSCTTPPPPRQKVVVQLDAAHSVLWSGFYAAQTQGYYAAEGLDVSLLVREDAPLAGVAEGTTDFAVSSGIRLVQARSQRQPLMAVAAIMRRNPQAIMSLAAARLTRPIYLPRTQIGVQSADLHTEADILLSVVLTRTALSGQQVTLTPTAGGIDALLSGEVDALAYAWATREAVAVRQTGQDVNLIYMSDYGALAYPNVLVTRAALIAEQPALVEAMVRATLRGYRYAVEHPEEAVQLTLAHDATLDTALQQASWAATIPYIDVGDTLPGMMADNVWHSTQEALRSQGWLTSSVTLESLYTNHFIYTQ
ncbi:MAG TPA: ABC transporter substrate-binding protein [Anaerolineae bacterium]|nr:ABC transporter substrate-binding protein [Anaerolineae bacterium]